MKTRNRRQGDSEFLGLISSSEREDLTDSSAANLETQDPVLAKEEFITTQLVIDRSKLQCGLLGVFVCVSIEANG